VKSFLIVVLFLGSLVPYAGSQTIEVAWDKTTVLIFDSPIQSVDRGSRLLLTQQDPHALNLLKLKAGSREFPETNLHVLTEDGDIHVFEVIYRDHPQVTTLDLRKVTQGKKAITPYKFDSEEFGKLADFLGSSPSKIIQKRFRYEVHFWLRGIYFDEGLLFFDLGARNNSTIPFQVAGPEARIRDTRSNKQGSSREQILSPWMDLSPAKPILTPGENKSLLMAFPAFTIANRKRLDFYLKEKNGDRELQLSLKGRRLLKAIPLPMFHTKPTTAHGSGEL